MTLPRLILTGASGFVGRHLLEAICDDWIVYGIARRSQARCGAPVHPNLTWFQVDIGDREALEGVFGKIKAEGGADVVVHLAAHYDFTGEEHPEYFRTNVDGLRNTLDLSVEAGVKQFFFSSSVAACELPPPGKALDETSPPDGRHIYAQTKRIGETMVGGYKDRFTPVIVRFAAMFSDHCEYPPLYMFFETWLSDAWNRHVLGGRGESAIPYLHVSDAVALLSRLLERRRDWKPREVLIASPDGATSHSELFAATMAHESPLPAPPILMPKVLCGPGMWARDLAGRLLGARPFERPWMAEYIDTVMAIDASKTRARTGWAPRDRLEVIRRLPFLLENRRTYPLDWHRLNRAAMKTVHVPQNLRLYQLLERHQAELVEAYSKALDDARLPSYEHVSPEDHEWHHKMILRQMMNAVRTQDRHVLVTYCGDLAERRYRKGFREEDLCRAIAALEGVCTSVLARDPDAAALAAEIHDDVSTPLKWGVDRIQETYETLAAADARRARAAATGDASSASGR
ncbi:MAG TPA: NAD(P)-dependent oxidoreductase [Thermoanaerobaculia bacterium]|jgi:nucleoside-diphosphate-sugar epimerase